MPRMMVHLGNAGKDRSAEKIADYALRFPEINFVGIDEKSLRLDVP
jgi:hypothetical protein